MPVDGVRVARADLQRTDPAWRTATYADAVIAGFILEVTLDGVTGLGATAAHPLQIAPDALEAELRSVVVPALLGADPYRANAIRELIRSQGVHRRTLLAADLALHDLLGRLAGMPCYAMWGGMDKPALNVVRMIGLKSPADLLGTAQGLLDEGYTHIKVKIGGDLRDDLDRVAILRDHVGPDVWIGVDGNGAYSAEDAITLARKLVRHDIKMLEQPVPYRDLDGLRTLTAASPIPIMADQCVTDVATAMDVCRREAAHVISVKITKMGSVDECRRVAEVCAGFGVGVHMGGSAAPAIVDMAQAHLAVSHPAISASSEVGEFRAVRGDPLHGVAIRNGQMVMTAEAGFGVQLGGSI